MCCLPASPGDTDRAYKLVLKKAPSAVLLGRYGDNINNPNPGPGHYEIKRDPFQNGKAIPMRPSVVGDRPAVPGANDSALALRFKLLHLSLV